MICFEMNDKKYKFVNHNRMYYLLCIGICFSKYYDYKFYLK